MIEDEDDDWDAIRIRSSLPTNGTDRSQKLKEQNPWIHN
jgi:hypothetical protein